MQLNKQIDAVWRMHRLVRAMVPLILYIGHADCGAWRWKGWFGWPMFEPVTALALRLVPSGGLDTYLTLLPARAVMLQVTRAAVELSDPPAGWPGLTSHG